MVRIAAESEPASGSVIAIAAQRPSKRACCSSSATEAIAELPSPWRGIESSRPTSPRDSSITPSAVAMLVAVAVAGVRAVASPRRTPVAPAPPVSPPSSMPSISAASMSSSFGRVCSSRS